MLHIKSKRIISALLSSIMLLQVAPMQALAMSHKEIKGMDQVWIWESVHLEEITPEEQEQGVIYMGTATAVAEERGWYGLTIYRDGNSDAEATIDLSTVDISATIGEDYDYYNQDVTYHEVDGNIMEMNVGVDTEQMIADYDTYVQEQLAQQAENLVETDQEQVAESYDEGVYVGETTPKALKQASETTGKSVLALVKEAETGAPTRAVESDQTPSEPAEIPEEQKQVAQEFNEYAHDHLADNAMTSSTLTVTFAPGQTEQYIALEITDDDIAEDTEIAMFMLSNPQGALLGANANLTMTIEDDEKHETAHVGFAEETTRLTGETGQITLERTGADYYMVSADVDLMNAENQIVDTQTCVFYPYETTATLDLDITGEGMYQAVITNLQACEPADILETSVYFAEDTTNLLTTETTEDLGEPVPMMATSSSDASSSNTFNLVTEKGTGNHPLEVRYTGERDNYGNSIGYIYDTGLTPNVIVGVYYFPNTFTNGRTGDKGNDMHYELRNAGEINKEHIFLEWYDSWILQNGTVYTHSNYLETMHYASVAADLQVVQVKYTGNKLDYRFGDEVIRDDIKHDRKLLTSTLSDDWKYTSGTSQFKVEVLDNCSDKTPHMKADVYGFAAFYSKFQVEIGQPGKMKFLDGAGRGDQLNQTTSPLSPVNASLGVGHSTRYYGQSLQLFDTQNSSSMMFRGNLIGYEVRNSTYNNVDPIWFIVEGKDTSDVHSATPTADTIIKSVPKGDTLSNIPFDDKFLSTIYRPMKDAYYDAPSDERRNWTRQDNISLTFTPLYTYADVTVKLLPTEIEGEEYSFDSLTSGTYHIGDTLRLTAEAPEGYHFAGCEYWQRATENQNDVAKYGTFGVQADGTVPFALDQNNCGFYELKPIFSANAPNFISFDMETSDVNVANLLTSTQVNLLRFCFDDYEFPDHIYIAEPGAAPDNRTPITATVKPEVQAVARALLGQISVIPGKVYQIEAYASEDTVPTFKNDYQIGMEDIHITGNVLDFIPDFLVDRNTITIGSKSAFPGSWYALSGMISFSQHSVRPSEDADTLEYFPATNGTVSAGGSASSFWITKSGTSELVKSNFVERATGDVNEYGNYLVPGIYGALGDYVSVHYTNGDTDKVFYVQLGSDATCDVSDNYVMQFLRAETDDLHQTNSDKSMQETGTLMHRKSPDFLPVYTTSSPEITEVTYEYTKSISNSTYKTSSNRVAIAQDFFCVTATVEPNGNELSKAVFTVDKGIGKNVDYTVESTGTGGSFTCTFGGKSMETIFDNGDKLFITLYGAEGRELQTPLIDEDGEPILDESDGSLIYTTSYMDVVYSTLFTGLTFYIPTLEVKPQEFMLDASDMPMDIPVFGKTAPKTTSGTVKFTKTDWPVVGQVDHIPYTLTFSENLNLYSHPTSSSALEKLKKSEDSIKEYNNSMDAAVKEDKDLFQDPENLAKAKKNANKACKDSLNKTFSKPILQANIIVLLSFDFQYDPEHFNYVMTSGQCVLGGAVNLTDTFYSSIYGIPVYLQVAGSLESMLMLSYSTGNDIDYDKFCDTPNLVKVLPAENSFGIYAHIMAKASVGVGICGVLGARGSLILNIYSYVDVGRADESGGKASLSGGISIDLLVFTVEYVPTIGTIGVGCYADDTGWGKARTARAISENMQLSGVSQYGLGTESPIGQSPMLRSAGLDSFSDYTTLVNGSAERTRPQIVQMQNGDLFMVYLGNVNDVPTLMYSVHDGNHWSDAKPVDDNGTPDTTPSIAVYGEDVLIAWADASEHFADIDTDDTGDITSALSKLDISACRYKANGTLTEPIKISNDLADYKQEFADYNPVIIADPAGKAGAGVMYVKRDVVAVQETVDLLATKTYETIAVAVWDGKGSFKLDEGFVAIEGDPLVSNLDAVLLPSLESGDNYLAISYAVDGDGDYNTDNDQEIYLQFYNITEKTYKPAIPMTDNHVADYAPQILRLSTGEIALTWLGNHTSTDANAEEQTYLFHMDLQDVLDEIDHSYGLKKYFNRDGKNWFAVPKKQFTETEDYTYEDSVFQRIADRELIGQGVPMQDAYGSITLNEYKLIEKDGNLCLLWTNAGSHDFEDLSTELYGALYLQSKAAPTVTDAEMTYYDRSGWSQPVKLTHFGDAVGGEYPNTVLDEIAVVVDDDNDLQVVSSMHTQAVTPTGMDYSNHKLISYEIEPTSDIAVVDAQADIAFPLAGDTVIINYQVENQGLLPIQGYTGKVTLGDTVVDVTCDDFILGGESVTKTATLTLDKALTSEDELTVALTANGTNVNVDTYTEDAPYGAHVTFSHGEVIENAEGKLVVPILATNVGNASNATFDITLSTDDSASDTVTIPALAAGESKTVEWVASKNVLSRNNFGKFGVADVKMAYAAGASGVNFDHALLGVLDEFEDETVDTETLSIYQPTLRMALSIGANKNEVYLEKGQTTALPLAMVGDIVVPNGDLTIDVKDEGVLSIDNGNHITTHKLGETEVTISCEVDGITYNRTITVHVVKQVNEQVTEPDSGDDQDDDKDDTNHRPTVTKPVEKPEQPEEIIQSFDIFDDVQENDWFADAVTYAVNNDLFNGVSDTKFAPYSPMTRAMMVTVLWNIMENPGVNFLMQYDDVPVGMWYAEAVRWAVAEGITKGMSDTSFAPNLALTREQLVVLLYRFAGQPTVTGNCNAYSDADQIADWAQTAMTWAVQQGIVSGVTPTTLAPKKGATRAEVATMMMRFDKLQKSK